MRAKWTVLLALLLAACNSVKKYDADWADGRVKAVNEEVLWRVTRLALQHERYPLQGRFDPNSRSTQTGWATNLAPFKGDGFRVKAEVKYEPVGPGEYDLSVRVMRETNEALARPLDLSYARWKPAPDDTARARILLQHIRSYLGGDSTFEVTDRPDPFEFDEEE